MNKEHGYMIKAIAKKYGLESRKNLLEEEMAELVQVICKMRRIDSQEPDLAKGITKESLEENFIEELADVYLVLMQIIYLVGMDDVEEVMIDKLERTIDRAKLTGIFQKKFSKTLD